MFNYEKLQGDILVFVGHNNGIAHACIDLLGSLNTVF